MSFLGANGTFTGNAGRVTGGNGADGYPGNVGGNGGAGGAGAMLSGANAVFTSNTGSLTGGTGGNGASSYSVRNSGTNSLGGVGGAGVSFTGSGTTTFTANTGTITGADGGSSVYRGGAGGSGGAGVAFIGSATATFTRNSGVVTGGNGGTAAGAAGAGGAGVIFAGTASTFTNANTVTGGNGGAGYAAGSTSAVGIAGGSGGAAVSFVGTGATFTNTKSVTGGNGGVGAYSGTTGGAGGSGGVGVSGSGLTVINSGTIHGGAGGTGGTSAGGSGGAGAGGTGGVGIVGSNLAITNSGSISGRAGGAAGNPNGGTSGIAGAAGDAIEFTGGTNSLTLQSGSTITGAISLDTSSTTLDFAQPTNATLSDAIIGSGSIIKTGAGTLTLSGSNTFLGSTTISTGGVELASSSGAGTGAITFAPATSASAALDLQTGAQTIRGTFANTLSNFNAGAETLDLEGFTFNALDAAYVSNGSSLTVMGGTGGTQSETFALSNGALLYAAQSDGNGGTLIETTVCFAAGTAIRITRGDIEVEHLRIGDLALTASGEARPIRWLGHRTVDCRRHPRRDVVMPVRIAAHAFGDNRPARDLLVSPGHSLCVDVLGEVLIPAFALINGSTITQEEVDGVTYWHVELEGGHDILLAENMPAESYLEMGNRVFFAENGIVALDASPDAPVATHADFCRPFHCNGALVDVVRAQLAARAARLGWRLEEQGFGDFHLIVDGVRIEPCVRGLAARFAVPTGAQSVWLVSGTTVPAEIDAGSPDRRSLGVCVAAITIDDGFGAPRAVPLDDPNLCVGFHGIESGENAAWRWTAGRARLPTSLWESLNDDAFLQVDFSGPALPRWVAPCVQANMIGPLALIA